jgi:hypothetical protein
MPVITKEIELETFGRSSRCDGPMASHNLVGSAITLSIARPSIVGRVLESAAGRACLIFERSVVIFVHDRASEVKTIVVCQK